MQPMIDFAPRTLRRAFALTSPATWLVIAAGLVCCVMLASQAWGLWHQTRARTMELARLQARLAQRRSSIAPLKPWTIPKEQANAVNQAIAQLNLPWRDVLDAIEAATPDTIALLSLEPDAAKHHLKGVGEAKTGDAMVAYVERLKQSSFFDVVVLTRHETNEQDPNRPLRFQFEAHWPERVP